LWEGLLSPSIEIRLRRHKFRFYARPALLVIDECGYLAYDAPATDLLFEVINHRYERNSVP
jgi:DNA replication protein DnaC